MTPMCIHGVISIRPGQSRWPKIINLEKWELQLKMGASAMEGITLLDKSSIICSGYLHIIAKISKLFILFGALQFLMTELLGFVNTTCLEGRRSDIFIGVK